MKKHPYDKYMKGMFQISYEVMTYIVVTAEINGSAWNVIQHIHQYFQYIKCQFVIKECLRV